MATRESRVKTQRKALRDTRFEFSRLPKKEQVGPNRSETGRSPDTCWKLPNLIDGRQGRQDDWPQECSTINLNGVRVINCLFMAEKDNAGKYTKLHLRKG